MRVRPSLYNKDCFFFNAVEWQQGFVEFLRWAEKMGIEYQVVYRTDDTGIDINWRSAEA